MCAQRAKDIMTSPAVTAPPDMTLHELVHLMKEEKVNRVPIVNKNGVLQGIVTRMHMLEKMAKYK